MKAESRTSNEPHISIARNLLNLPFSILFFFISIIALVINLFIPQRLFFDVQKKNQLSEEAKRIADMRPFVKAGQTLLDVGCGNGRFGKAIAHDLGLHVSGVDVVDYADPDIDIHRYDGHKLPFEDKSFDVVIVAFVLHHIVEQDAFFEELKRVARHQIIVFEDTFFSPWQRLFVMWNDYVSNILMGYVKYLKSTESIGMTQIPMPYTFRSVSQWIRFFDAHGTHVEAIDVRHAQHKPHSKVTFIVSQPS